MLRKISGEELTIALEEYLVPDARPVKPHLSQRQDFPPHFRQMLIFHGQCLEDSATLHSGMALEPVLLAFIPNPSPVEVQYFTAAAGAGHFDDGTWVG